MCTLSLPILHYVQRRRNIFIYQGTSTSVKMKIISMSIIASIVINLLAKDKDDFTSNHFF